MENSLPWVEKYRPNSLNDVVSHEPIIKTLTKLIEQNKIPHMIFYGPPGTGKTTTILACAKKIYGDSYKTMILELNGSDDRGINVVREQIKNFSANSSGLSSIMVNKSECSIIHNKIKLVILDEADAMTYDAQFALRRIIELYTGTTRFCLICNYLSKIIQALQSRCQMFVFAPIGLVDHLCKLNMIIGSEHIIIDHEVNERIIELSDGDMRRSINLLQSLSMATKKGDRITLREMNKLIGYPSDEVKKMIIDGTNGKNLADVNDILNKIEIESNLSNNDILREVSTYYGKTYIGNLTNIKKIEMLKIINLFDDLAKVEVNQVNSTNNNIQLLAISSILYNYHH
jgi:replication factor C subunit 3/5